MCGNAVRAFGVATQHSRRALTGFLPNPDTGRDFPRVQGEDPHTRETTDKHIGQICQRVPRLKELSEMHHTLSHRYHQHGMAVQRKRRLSPVRGHLNFSESPTSGRQANMKFKIVTF